MICKRIGLVSKAFLPVSILTAVFVLGFLSSTASAQGKLLIDEPHLMMPEIGDDSHAVAFGDQAVMSPPVLLSNPEITTITDL